jgi:TPR repeat protein
MPFLIIAVFFSGCFLYNENYSAGQNAIRRGDIATAKEQFKIGCDVGGDSSSCYGYFYYTYYDKEYEQSIPYAKKTCDLGNYKGCAALGELYETGEGLDQNYSKAAVYYEQACKMGFQESCERVARLYSEGLGVPQNFIKAQIFAEMSCITTHSYNVNAKKCYEFGSNYLSSGNVVKALNFFERACEADRKQGCAEAALLYTQQNPKDYFKISSLYERACGAGDKQSCYKLGILYSDRKNPISNLKEARNYFQEACSYSNEKMCYQIALLYADKKGGMYNIQEAKNYFQRACNFGLRDGCNAASKIK